METPSSSSQERATPLTSSMVSSRRKLFLFIGLFLILLSGLGVGLVVVRRQADIRNQAFTGATINFDVLQRAVSTSGGSVNPLKYVGQGNSHAKNLFTVLSTSYANPEIQQISAESLGISGVVFFKYDDKANKSFLYSRMENILVPTDALLKMWLISKEGDSQQFLPAGFAEFELESGQIIAYNVFGAEGDVRSKYSYVVYSFDANPEAQRPEDTIITVAF